MTQVPQYRKPLPVIHPESEPFWTALKERQFKLQRCLDCGTLRYPIGPVCYKCFSGSGEWTAVSGRATLVSWIVVEQATGNNAWQEDVPYVVAFVKLAEGPQMTTNIVECDPFGLEVGIPLEIVFDDVTPEVTLPKFRPA